MRGWRFIQKIRRDLLAQMGKGLFAVEGLDGTAFDFIVTRIKCVLQLAEVDEVANHGVFDEIFWNSTGRLGKLLAADFGFGRELYNHGMSLGTHFDAVESAKIRTPKTKAAALSKSNSSKRDAEWIRANRKLSFIEEMSASGNVRELNDKGSFFEVFQIDPVRHVPISAMCNECAASDGTELSIH